ncbi:hypothetical protein M0R45_001805 [Rubus argutus]|uniref:Pentatricopeptide repeat-containing protein n=1 Tax=Rubus argutus TaxID=59490 RepID=A0AAW1VL50_RUBAR
MWWDQRGTNNFDEIKLQKDVISWNAMIGGYASHGFAAEASELFTLMKRLKVRPAYITFIAELAKVAAEALMKLEPDSSAPYVLLYNMYADA